MFKIKLFMCCQITFLCLSSLFATENTVSPQTTKEELNIDTSLCTKEVLMTFFPRPIVKAVLIKHNIPEDKAEAISKDLANNSQDVAKEVEIKAAKMEPNPFTDLSQRDTAVVIFRETLYEVFAKGLKEHQVTISDNEIQTILDDMQEVKGRLFVECIKRENSESPKTDED